jgi:hypothetical protein
VTGTNGANGRNSGGSGARADSHLPAHRRGGRGRPVAEPRDRRTLVVRSLALGVVAVAVAAAVGLDGDGGTAAAPPTPAALMPAVAPASRGSSTWYCAAGTAVPDGEADHTVVIANAGDAPVAATLDIVPGDVRRPDTPVSPLPDAATRTLTIGPRSRVEVRLGDVVTAPLAAAVVEVDGPGVAVEHRLSGPHGADVAPCASFAAPAWHFAWGSTTRDARELVVLFNPFPSPATVDATFTTEDGPREPLRLQGFPVPARSVVGIDLGDDVTRSEQVAATFRARSGRVVAERVERFDGSLGYVGLTLGLGAPEAAGQWVFADGVASAPSPQVPAAGGDGVGAAETTTTTAPATTTTTTTAAPEREQPTATERIVVYNPSDERARVTVELRPTPGSGEDAGPLPPPFGLTVGAGGYEVVDYGAQPRVVAGQPHATVVRSTNGVAVVAERVTVDSGPRRRSGAVPGEITASPGSPYGAEQWAFPTLALGVDGVTTFSVYNPDPDRPVRVEVAALTGDPGSTGATVAQAPPGGRVAVRLDAGVVAGAAGVVVRASAPVVAERTVQRADGLREAQGAGLPLLDAAAPL